MAMSMNQVGSNYFVGGDFIVPQGCAGCQGATVPDEFDPSQMGQGNDQEGADTSFGMNMSQLGSNYFVMGDYVVGDMEFLTIEDFVPCLDITGLEGCAIEMQQQRIYDCVVKAEQERRQNSMLPTEKKQRLQKELVLGRGEVMNGISRAGTKSTKYVLVPQGNCV